MASTTPLADSRHLSRKFLAAMFALAAGTALVACGVISDGIYCTIVLGTVSAYITGNVAQKATAPASNGGAQ